MIVIFGGTGGVGRQITDLLACNGVRVRVVTRTPDRATVPAGVDVHKGDLHDHDAVVRALHGAEAVVCTAHGGNGKGRNGPTGIEGAAIPRLIDTAVDRALRQFVYVSTASARADSPVGFFRHKFAVEERLRSSGLPFAIIRPTHLLDTWVPTLAESIAGKGKAIVMGTGQNPVSWVAGADIAQVAAALALRAGDGLTVELGGPEALPLRHLNELIAVALGAQINKEQAMSARMLATMSLLARPVNEVLSRQMGMGALLDTRPQTVESSAAWRRFEVVPTPPRIWLTENLSALQKKEGF